MRDIPTKGRTAFFIGGGASFTALRKVSNIFALLIGVMLLRFAKH